MVINLTGFESIVQASMPSTQLAVDVLRVLPCKRISAIIVANMSADSLLVVLKHSVALPKTRLACLWPWLHACCVYDSP